MALKFDWDLGNLMKNEIKYNISVLEAESVFDDNNKIVFFDPKHSKEEYRYICIGKNYLNQIVFAAFTFRGEYLIRVISIRKANKKEGSIYEKFR